MSTTAQSAPRVGGYPIQCPKCPYITAQLSRLRKHAVNIHHGNLQYQVYVCSECGAVSSDMDLLIEHREEIHGALSTAPILLQRIHLRSPGQHASSVNNGFCSMDALIIDGTSVPQNNCSGTPSRANVLNVGNRSEPTQHNWSSLVQRTEDRKFLCLTCQDLYSGRTEAVFHIVTRHLLPDEIENDLAKNTKLSEGMKTQIRRWFLEGMRTRAGIHYKNADQVESALFLTIDLHLRRLDDEASVKCAECGTVFPQEQLGVHHITEKLNLYLPSFMKARSGPWSLGSRPEWVWVVPDQCAGLSVVDNNDDSSPTPMETATNADTPAASFSESNDTPKASEVGGTPSKLVRFRKHIYQEEQAQGEEVINPFDVEIANMASKEASLDEYFIISEGQNKSKCSACPDITFANERATKTHIVETHLNIHPALCPFCDYRGDTRAIRTHAMRVHQKENDVVEYICNPLYFSLWQKVKVKASD